MIEDKKINIKKELVDKFMTIDEKELEEQTTTNIRERMQYGTELKLESETYEQILSLAKEAIEEARQTLEKI